MKRSLLRLIPCALVLGASTGTAHATSCTVDVLQLSSGPKVVFGSTDVYDVSEVRVVNEGQVVIQTIQMQQNGEFGDVLSSAIEPLDQLYFVFVRKDNRVICMQTVSPRSLVQRRPTILNGTSDDPRGGN